MRHFLVCQELSIGRGDLTCIVLVPSKTLCSVALYKLGKGVDLLTGELCSALYVDTADASAVLDSTCKHLKATAVKNRRKVGKLKAEAKVGLIRTEAIHCLVVGHSHKRKLKVDALEFLEYTLKEALCYRDNIVLCYKGHLKVDLSKLRLTVCTKVLVTEAACDLNITVEARKHEKLLIELRRLRKSVELSVVNTGRNEIVSCALGSGSYKVRSLDIDKALICKIFSCDAGDLCTVDDILLKVGTAKVEITVLKTKLRLYVTVLNDLKRRSLGNRKYLELVNCDLNVACRNGVVYR